MKVYISADIEGTAGITDWNEATLGHVEYPEHQQKMTNEVLAACQGALAAGATEILIKDAHDSGRNIMQSELPSCARLIRGWSGHPYSMVQELDKTFAAVIMLGYHSPAGSETNPLAHTMNLNVQRMKLNGRLCSEFMLHSYAAATFGVPVTFLAGDKALCEEAPRFNPGIKTAWVLEGVGKSTINRTPKEACRLIREGVEGALKGNLKKAKLPLPKTFTLDIEYNDPFHAYKAQWYPGAKHLGDRVVRFAAKDFLDIMRALRFVL